MTRKLDIEANLDRSLANQVKAPRLNPGFDAAVWARIEAGEQRATNPVQVKAETLSSPRWLFVINVVGVTIAAVLVVIFGVQSFSGVSLSVPMPEVSASTTAEILKFATQIVTFVSLIFGLLFTPIGRRLRAELS
jgi:negative regulator of sigma E activity